MFMATASVYGTAILLMGFSTLASSTLSQRIKKVAIYLANDVGYALVIFCTPNAVTALCIEV